MTGTPTKGPYNHEFNPIDRENECVVTLENGLSLVGQSANANAAGTEYVRFVTPDGYEVAYWDNAEWAEDPECVMGAILAVMCDDDALERATEDTD